MCLLCKRRACWQDVPKGSTLLTKPAALPPHPSEQDAGLTLDELLELNPQIADPDMVDAGEQGHGAWNCRVCSRCWAGL